MFDELRRFAAFEHVGAWWPGSMTIGAARTEIVPTLNVSSPYLPVLGAQLLHGRNFDARDDQELTDHRS